MDSIVSFVIDRWPVLALISIAVIIAAIVCKWYFSRFVTLEKTVAAILVKFDVFDAKFDAMDAKFDKMNNRLDETIARYDAMLAQHDVSIVRHDVSITRYDAAIAKHDDSIASLKDSVTEVIAYLISKDLNAGAVLTLKHSPRCLSEEGLRLFDEIGGAAFLEANGKALLAIMEQKRPKTPYDVELYALDVLYGKFSDDIFNDMKRWVYNSSRRKVIINGEEKYYDVTMNEVLYVLSIPLRDMYLEMHPELQ